MTGKLILTTTALALRAHLGRKIVYRGADLNAWVKEGCVGPSVSGRS
ncbi:hypothetical protein [Sulfitobacter sabulilitoris]|nr:hypothetical protein [Sulfitobacter sabulilitoris]